MKKTYEPIVFFGSGPVAAQSLESLYENFTVHAVVTKPRPPHHKTTPPVIDFAQKRSIPTYYVRDKNELKKLFDTEKLTENTLLGVLVDFGIIIPRAVINHFKLGIVNSHFSLLPEWRGADPITFAVLSGQDTTGVSLMIVVEAMDEGPILAQENYSLTSSITTPLLTEALIELSNSMLASFLPLYMSGELSAVEQNKKITPSYSRKLTKSDGELEWHKDAIQLEREIRAFAGWPKSRTAINGMDVIITKAHVVDVSGTPGAANVIDKQLIVHCGTQSLIIDTLKPAGKTEMSGQDFVRGHPL